MAAGTALQATLSAQEIELLIELLEGECRRLPVEIHHTYRGEFKEHLRRRLALAEELLERLKANRTA
jgi:hypothetical protein